MIVRLGNSNLIFSQWFNVQYNSTKGDKLLDKAVKKDSIMNRSQTDTGSAPKALLPSSCTNNQAGSTQNSKNSKNINKSTKVGCYVCGSESVEYIGILSGNTIHSSAKYMKDLLILCKTHQSMYLEKVLGVIFHNFIIPEFNINFPFSFRSVN